MDGSIELQRSEVLKKLKKGKLCGRILRQYNYRAHHKTRMIAIGYLKRKVQIGIFSLVNEMYEWGTFREVKDT